MLEVWAWICLWWHLLVKPRASHATRQKVLFADHEGFGLVSWRTVEIKCACGKLFFERRPPQGPPRRQYTLAEMMAIGYSGGLWHPDDKEEGE